ncbi:MAG: phospholipase D family protein [Desulfobulbaceae bacterium]|nr:phospholipase D family protein [Desulfobulbaceae bacterium]
MAPKPTNEPDLFSNPRTEPIPDPLRVKPTDMNTIVDPFDPVDNNGSIWFPQLIGQSDIRTPNEVIGYVDNSKAFRDICNAIRTAHQPGHFIYLLAWSLHTEFPLVPEDPSSTIAQLFTKANDSGVDIRAMLFHQARSSFPGGDYAPPLSNEDNQPAVDFIRSLQNGKAIHDDRVLWGDVLPGFKVHYRGVHHQKVLVVNGAEGLVAFQGGCDLHPNRLGNQPLHDVHTRIRGLAAQDLWTIFVQRWCDHPYAKHYPPIQTSVKDAATLTDDLQVQIGRTFPNSTKRYLYDPSFENLPDGDVLPPPPQPRPYAFSPTGEQTAKALVLNAITQSRKFIYIEDQFLVDMSISDALKAALPNLKKLIILICAAGAISDEMHQPCYRRKLFIDNLKGSANPGQVIVCSLKNIYVHSKAWIFDDKFAIIGSANLSRRGYSHDSEQNAGIFDPNTKRRFFFAHELRMKLWAKHLGTDNSRMRVIDFCDPIASSVHWSDPPPECQVRPYPLPAPDPEATGNDPKGEPWPIKNLVWDQGFDPDGS